jgi:hypothetical protein
MLYNDLRPNFVRDGVAVLFRALLVLDWANELVHISGFVWGLNTRDGRDDSLLNGLFGCRGSDARMVRIGLVAEDAVVGSAPAGSTNKQGGRAIHGST